MILISYNKYEIQANYTPITFRQFLTKFSTSDWFLDLLKISTEHGSRVPVGSCVSETVNNIENIKRKVVLVILVVVVLVIVTHLVSLSGLARKSVKHNF